MSFSDVKKFFLHWRKELGWLAVLVVLASAGLLLLWQFGLVTFVKGKVTPVQIITALFVLMGLYWTARRVLAAEDNVRVAEEGRITERFTKAIEQLGQEGDDKMAIRLGGIYALERIAKDSEKDHGPVMEVLTAYVREKAAKDGEYALEAAVKPTTDVQAILTVIGRRKMTDVKNFGDLLDLSNTHLAGLFLYDANLSGTDLSGANLHGAILHGTDLSGVILYDTDLSRVSLFGPKNLTAEQIQSAKSWHEAFLPDHIKDLLEPPAPAS